MKVRVYRKISQRWLIGAVLCGILIGLGLAYIRLDIRIVFWVSMGLLPFIFLKRKPAVVIALLLGIGLGNLRGLDFLVQKNELANFYGSKIAISGTVLNDPTYDEKGRLILEISDIAIGDKNPSGTVRVYTFAGTKTVYRGDHISATGKLQGEFGNIQGYIFYAELEKVQHSNSILEKLRREFIAGTYNSLPEPGASLGLGFLIGTRDLLPEWFSEQLRVLGLTHIIAVSGYNLTILVRFARRAGMKLSKRFAVVLAILLLAGFISVTGSSPSINRAVLVTGLALAAWYYGRKVHPILLLLFSSSITAYINPNYLWSDLGWWLSFLAFYGVLVVAPLVKTQLIGNKDVHWMLEIIIETSSAQLMTMPLIMLIFREVSLLALVSNILILPLIPFAMLLTFVAGFGGMFLPAIAGWIAWPARVLLNYMVGIVDQLHAFDWGNVSVGISSLGMAILYLIMIFMTLGFVRHTKIKQLQWQAKSVVE